MKCDVCGSTNTYTKNHKHVYYIKNEKVVFISKRRFCEKCNNLVYDKELDNIASREAINNYNSKYGLPKEKVVELRKKYNLSQELFAKIIGCAKKTLVSYELGKSIPNDIYLITLKTLYENPETLLIIINSNKERFSEKEYLKITKELDGVFGNNSKQLFLTSEFEPTIYNGFTKFSIDKIKNMILLFADNSVLKTKLLKEMFYADFIAYKEIGSSITGLEYAKADFGPVPDDFEKIINELSKEEVIEYKIEFKNEYECHNILRKVKIQNKVFSNKEINIIERVKEFFNNYTSKKIVEFSHKEKAFIETNFYNNISYDYAFDINDNI